MNSIPTHFSFTFFKDNGKGIEGGLKKIHVIFNSRSIPSLLTLKGDGIEGSFL